MNLTPIYRKYGTKILIIPLVAFVLFAYLATVNPGISYGIDFKGGVRVSFSSTHPVPVDAIAEKIRRELGVPEVSVVPTEVPGTGKYGGIVEVVYPDDLFTKGGDASDPAKDFKDAVIQIIKSEVPDAENIVIRDIVPALGAKFWELAVKMLLLAVFLLKVVVLIAFRHNTPVAKVLGVLLLDVAVILLAHFKVLDPLVALAVILIDTVALAIIAPSATPAVVMLWSSVFDALGMLALMAVFNVPLTLQTIMIILMMVGYSIDTDIVLSTHILKRSEREEGDEYERAGRASSTGLHMSGTTLVSMLFILAVGYLTRNLSVIRIGMVMIFGVVSDVIITWLFNAPLMIAWVRKNASNA
ncbi:MAG TPA: hypothetical protein EYH23_02025 [Euryarchaeota archaeon]|nr:hypothetical protein [Euryarchaeota archaeon]